MWNEAEQSEKKNAAINSILIFSQLHYNVTINSSVTELRIKILTRMNWPKIECSVDSINPIQLYLRSQRFETLSKIGPFFLSVFSTVEGVDTAPIHSEPAKSVIIIRIYSCGQFTFNIALLNPNGTAQVNTITQAIMNHRKDKKQKQKNLLSITVHGSAGRIG